MGARGLALDCVDPDCCDLVLGARAMRLPFETRIANGEEARREFVRLVGVARAKRTSGELIWAPFGP